MEFTFSEVDVNQLMFDIEQLFRMRLEDKSAVIQIIRETPPDECVMYTDRNRLQQVVSNFMTNAVKFTDEGSIILAIIVVLKVFILCERYRKWYPGR